MTHARYYAFSRFMQDRYGGPLFKVSVDAGFSCPNLDGTVAVGGCTFCNNASFRPAAARASVPVEDQVRRGMEFLRRRYRAERFLAYFQNFSNTHAPLPVLGQVYEAALSTPGIEGLVVGTRPDCLDEPRLQLLEEIARRAIVMVEMGVQSTHDDSLKRMNRAHTYADFESAVRRSRGRGLVLGTHIILGFPWETRPMMLSTAAAVSLPGIDVLKVHHLQVIAGTAMAREYQQAAFWTWPYEAYVSFVVDFLEALSPEIAIGRLFSIGPSAMVLAPRWSRSRHEIQHDIETEMARRNTWQGREWKNPESRIQNPEETAQC